MQEVRFIGSLRFKLIAMLAALIIIPMLFFSFFFLNWIKDIIGQKYSESALQSISESSKNIDYNLNDLREYSNLIMTNRDFTSMLNNPASLDSSSFESTIRGFFTSREDVEGIYVNAGNTTYSIGSNKVAEDKEASVFKTMENTKGEIHWISTRKEKIRIMSGDFDKYYFSLGRKIIDLNTLKELGILVIDIDESILAKSYENLLNYGEVFVCDAAGVIISHPDKSKIGKNIGNEQYIKDILASNTSTGKLQYGISKNDGLVIYSTCSTTGWKLIKIIPTNYLYKELESMNRVFIAAGSIYVVITLLLAMLFAIMVSKPITNMMNKMKEVEKGNLDISIPVKRKDEIGQLGLSFNNMIYDVKFLINKLLEEERIKKEIELEALHAQINPHFLYNTLNTIKWMAKMQGAGNISSTVTALIKLLRVSINLSNERISLAEEIDYVKNYVLIQKIRFNEQFSIAYNLDEDCLECSVPKLILQPIVENSIIYGAWEEAGHALTIEINAFRNKDKLMIIVKDNGPGIEEEILKKILKTEKNVNKFSSVGLNNINERIKHYYGEGNGIDITTELGSGTIVTITLPYSINKREIQA